MHDPLLDAQLPKSTYVPSVRLPPEVDDIAIILNAGFQYTPITAPILVLASITGARFGELVAPRSSDIDWTRSRLRVWAAMDVDGNLKEPKRAWHRPDVDIDEGTLAMLRELLDEIEERCTSVGAHTADDPFLFSLERDGSKPLSSNYVTKQPQVLKIDLGVEAKKPQTIALEDEALRLRRSGYVDRSGRLAPVPRDVAAVSYRDIGIALDRTESWAQHACAALRRDQPTGLDFDFNLSFNGFRKFTSSELLDAGFNISVASDRQGTSRDVLAKQYTKARMPARREAAEHLGNAVHRARRAPRSKPHERSSIRADRQWVSLDWRCLTGCESASHDQEVPWSFTPIAGLIDQPG